MRPDPRWLPPPHRPGPDGAIVAGLVIAAVAVLAFALGWIAGTS